jgi:Rieske Fe-S protein
VNSDLRTARTGSSRRAILAGTGSIGVLTVLAACASNSPSNGPVIPGDGGGQSSDAPAPDLATPTGPVDLGKAASIPVGGGLIFAKESVVVTQPSRGTFRAFSSTCTHQGCTVGSVAGGRILCPCHGSEYSIVDGSVQSGPAPLPLPRKTITITDGDIFLKT